MPRWLFALLLSLVAASAAAAPNQQAQPAQPAPGGVTLPPGLSLPPGVDVNQLLQKYGQAPQPAIKTPSAAATQIPLSPPGTAIKPILEPRTLFEEYAKKLIDDGKLTPERRSLLRDQALKLGLDPVEALRLAEAIAADRTRTLDVFMTQAKALSVDGKLSDDDRRFLETRGRDMGMEEQEVTELLDFSLERLRRQDLYRSVLDAFLQDGLVDASEEKQLAARRLILGLPDEVHQQVLQSLQQEKKDRAQDVLTQMRDKDLALQAPEEELELYGRSLFQKQPELFAPAKGLAPPEGYRVGPGDRFDVSLWGRFEANYTLEVDSEGKVQFPKVGPVRVGGLTFAEARDLLRRRAESITGVTAAVNITEMRSVQVLVVGEAEQPGSVTLTPLSTAIQALMAAGGPTPLGSLRNVLIRRAGKVLSTLDLYEFLRTGDARGDRPLQSGDVVVIPRAERLIRLSGKVKRPAIYELKQGEGLRALLDYAGGLSADAAGGRIQVERARKNQARVVLQVALPEVKGDVPLQDGDAVRVFPLPPEAENKVGLFGHVYQPGTFAYREGMRVRDLVSADNLKPEVDLAYGVVLRETGTDRSKTVIPFEPGKALSGPEPGENLPLRARDEVYVFSKYQFRPPFQATVTGELRSPGLYRIEKGARVADLVRLAGGVSQNALLTRAELLRYLPDRSRETLYLNLGAALKGDSDANKELEDQDELVVHPVWTEGFRQVVLVEGEVKGALDPRSRRGKTVRERFDRMLGEDQLRAQALLDAQAADLLAPGAWRPGGVRPDPSRPDALRPDALRAGSFGPDALRSASPPAGAVRPELLRPELLRNGTARPEAPRSASRPDPLRPGVLLPGPQAATPEEKERWASEIPLTRGMKVRDAIFKAGGLTKDAYLPVAHLYRTDPVTKEITIHTFDLGKALEGDPQNDLALADLDHLVVHSAFEFVPVRRVAVGGMVNNPGEYPYGKNMRVRDLVVAAGGLKDEAYLSDAEIVRTQVVNGEAAETRTLRFSLEKAMAGDPQENLPVQPYDKLLVKKIPDWQEAASVTFTGEVRFPGTYFVAKGEKLSSVLRRAGGFTQQAYLRAAVFTRESARLQQQVRLDELRESLQQAVLRASSSEAQASIEAEDLAAQKQFLASQQALIDKLGKVRATGRVVIQLQPLDRLEGSQWDLTLEDGDSFNIPKAPQTVTVVGQVYNPTSLLWQPGERSVEHYLRLTGGPTPDAEAKQIYVVRADGTVVSPGSMDNRSWWSRKGVRDVELFPGDTILVPEKVIRPNYMKDVKDITQILYQIAIAARVAITLF
ncbi:MAG: SLBB domain-containing protein [Deltaproteobacteria bacterium]|nr:SLBB domain-containing protein [Deltaproteobacteria bacterium]